MMSACHVRRTARRSWPQLCARDLINALDSDAPPRPPSAVHTFADNQLAT